MLPHLRKLAVPAASLSLRPASVYAAQTRQIANPFLQPSHVSRWFVLALTTKEACAVQSQRCFQNLHGPHVATCAGYAWLFTCSSSEPNVWGSKVSTRTDAETASRLPRLVAGAATLPADSLPLCCMDDEAASLSLCCSVSLCCTDAEAASLSSLCCTHAEASSLCSPLSSRAGESGAADDTGAGDSGVADDSESGGSSEDSGCDDAAGEGESSVCGDAAGKGESSGGGEVWRGGESESDIDILLRANAYE